MNGHTTGFHTQTKKLVLRTKQLILYEGTAQYLSFEWPPTLKAFIRNLKTSLRKQPIFHDATTGLPAKMTSEERLQNSIRMTCHCPYLGSASDWSCRERNLLQPIIFAGSGGVAKCWLFSQATSKANNNLHTIIYSSRGVLTAN